jgi:hypothetical protein
MINSRSRRDFLKSSTLLTASAGLVFSSQSLAQEPIERVGGPALKVSLNAWTSARKITSMGLTLPAIFSQRIQKFLQMHMSTI